MTNRKNLTNEIKEYFDDLISNKTHPLPCRCCVCLYSQYKKRTSQRGRKYGKLTFFLNWLVHLVKMEYLKRNGTAEEIFYCGRKAWKFDAADYAKAPYIKETKRLLESLYEISTEVDSVLDIEYLFTYHSRTQKVKFQELIEELSIERWKAWQGDQVINSQEEEKVQKEIQESFDFVKRVADFILSKKEKLATQQELLKHFSDKRLRDLKEIHIFLEKDYSIFIKDKQGYNKRTVNYSYRRLSKKDIDG